MIVVGLDLSLNATGAARLDTETGGTRVLTLNPHGRRGHARLDWHLNEISALIVGARLVVIEGLAFGARSGQLDQIYGHHMLIRHQIWRRGIPYAICTPNDLKTYLTGKGNADKRDIVRELRATFPSLQLSDSDDEADALGLATLGCRWKGQLVDTHRTRWPHVLEHVRWPDHEGEPRQYQAVKSTAKRR